MTNIKKKQFSSGKRVAKVTNALSVETFSKKSKIQQQRITTTNSHPISVVPSPTVTSSNRKLSALQQKFERKLDGARFRSINEKLYTVPSSQSLGEFQQDPSLFDVYHVGFREQIRVWPQNPLDIIIDKIKRGKKNLIVADMGCGDARLAQSITNKVHSFDLVSRSPLVTACDIAHVPLSNESVDLVVFCLSLMGTNVGEFIIEAHRILKTGGVVMIAEVRSRFEGQEATGEDGMKNFLSVLRKSGFDVISKSFPNEFFFLLDCVKTTRPVFTDRTFSAKPCVYKKR